MDTSKPEDKVEEPKALELIILLNPDNSIEIKGQAYKNEMVAMFLLEKAKDMVKMFHANKMVEASQKKQIIGATGFQKFIHNIKGR